MDKWEYLSLNAVWNREGKKWEGHLVGGKVIKAESTQELLNPLGIDRWELIAYTPSFYSESRWVEGQVLHSVTHWEVTAYRAVLKRRLP